LLGYGTGINTIKEAICQHNYIKKTMSAGHLGVKKENTTNTLAGINRLRRRHCKKP
jgi:hypothetical protein